MPDSGPPEAVHALADTAIMHADSEWQAAAYICAVMHALSACMLFTALKSNG